MSLIHDYLKLTQDKDISTHDAAGEVPPALLTGKRRKKRAYLPIGILLAAGLLSVSAYILWPDFQDKNSVSPAKIPVAEIVKKEVLTAPPVSGEGEETALINAAVKTVPEPEQIILVAAPAQPEPLPVTKTEAAQAVLAIKTETATAPVQIASLPEPEKPLHIDRAREAVISSIVAEVPVEAAKTNVPVPDVQEEAAAREKNFERFFQAGMMAQKEGKLQAAEAFYLKAGENNQRSLELLTNLAAVYVGQGKYSLAEETLNKILEKDSKNSKALVNLGVISLHRQQHERAKAMFLEALQFNPYEETALVNMAYMSQKEGDTAQAEKYYRESIKISPDNLELQLAYCSLLEQGSRYAEARERYRRCLELEDVKSDRKLYEKIFDRIQLLASY